MQILAVKNVNYKLALIVICHVIMLVVTNLAVAISYSILMLLCSR